MRRRTKIAGIGAILLAILSIITLGLIKRNKGSNEEE